MNLMVEVGNTTIKLGLFNLNELVDQKRFEKNQAIDLTFLNSIPISKVLISGSGNYSTILPLLKQYKTIIFDKKMIQDINFEYDSLESLGNDRILNCYAAKRLFPTQNNLIIDLGTCITFSFLDSQNTFKGGSISPGLAMRAKALHDYTFKLPLVETTNTFFDPIGSSTQESILSGLFLGIESEINHRIQLFLEKYSQINIIITGGDVVFFKNRIKNKIFANSNLTLIGMNYLTQIL